jgi:hypothetical protein
LRAEVFPIELMGSGGYLQPKDPFLYELTEQFCERYLIAPRPDLTDLNRVWVCAEVDEEGTPTEVIGICGIQPRWDIPVFRVLKSRATKMLRDRMNGWFADNGIRGHEIFIFVSDNPDPTTKCPYADQALQAFKARPAERYAITIR